MTDANCGIFLESLHLVVFSIELLILIFSQFSIEEKDSSVKIDL